MTISDNDLTEFLASEPGPNTPPPGRPQLTDLACAELLNEAHGQDLHYCHPWGQWLLWKQGRWQPDQEGWIQHLAKQTLRILLQDATHIEDTKQRNTRIRDIQAAEKASRIQGAIQLTRSEPLIAVLPDHLDANLHHLNTPTGTIDLRTGHPHPHRRRDLITKQTGCPHNPEARCPAWDRFLQRVLPDPEIREFLARATGYSMLGGNPEQILLILWGQGANGKSTYLETIRALMGDYGQQAPPETFLAKHDGIPNDVARLRGARFVAAVEIAEGRRLNEPLIKRLTGGDTMTARFMRQEYFEFQPQFTPWLATNHKPEIRGTDEAIWRRIRLIPFLETIPPAERDHHLKAKLLAELPGILNWALSGCAAYQQDGLAEPAAVRAATRDYRAGEDEVGRFIEDRCQLQENASALSADLWRAWQEWAREQGADQLSARALGLRLSERGLQSTKTGRGRAWRGIRLLSAQQDLL